jgi:uroporphyrinogen-III synthase
MHVLITRPLDDGETLKSRVEQLGLRASLAPLIEIVPNDIPLSALKDATALIATSRNALKALARSSALRFATSLPLFVVGAGTAATARELGFRDVFEGTGTAADLVPVVVGKLQTAGGIVVHLAGDVLAFDLVAALAREDVNIRAVTAYRSVAADTLSPAVVEALHNRDIDAVMLMSARTAETWTRLASALSPPPDPTPLTYLCLSEAVANALGPGVAAKKISIASRPALDEMLVLLKRLAARTEAG